MFCMRLPGFAPTLSLTCAPRASQGSLPARLGGQACLPGCWARPWDPRKAAAAARASNNAARSGQRPIAAAGRSERDEDEAAPSVLLADRPIRLCPAAADPWAAVSRRHAARRRARAASSSSFPTSFFKAVTVADVATIASASRRRASCSTLRAHGGGRGGARGCCKPSAATGASAGDSWSAMAMSSSSSAICRTGALGKPMGGQACLPASLGGQAFESRA